MIRIISFVLLLISIETSAQKLSFKNELVDTVKISSYDGYFHGADQRTTTEFWDEYIICYDSKKDKYVLWTYQRTTYTSTYESEKSYKKIKAISTSKKVNRKQLENLLFQFENGYAKLTLENSGISKKEVFGLTQKRHVKEVLKRNGKAYFLRKGYSTKEKRDSILNGCKNIDTFNVYLGERFNVSGLTITSSINSRLDVEIITASNQFKYHGQYPNLVIQPWHDFSQKRDSFRTIKNLKINHALIEILPKKFKNINALKVNELTYDYIEWYLKRNGIF